ncbi:hypothetical protein F1880_002657 [Penicillium rolfsii]|nr:hypothetical protein F1880_002657 [Penicillium rolfsii]
MPTTAPAKCPDYPTQYLVYERQSECRSMGRTLGHLQVAAEEPRPVRISSTNIGVNNVSTSAIQLHLTFESTTNAPPPQLCKLRSILEVATYYGTSPWEDYPKAEDMESSNTDREACVTTTPLRSLDLTSTQWEKLPTFYSATKDLTDCASVSSSRTSSQPSWHVSVTVPVDLPEEQALVPTFHSCLVSRTYTVDLALSYDVPSSICKSSMNLRIPLEVVFGSRK